MRFDVFAGRRRLWKKFTYIFLYFWHTTGAILLIVLCMHQWFSDTKILDAALTILWNFFISYLCVPWHPLLLIPWPLENCNHWVTQNMVMLMYFFFKINNCRFTFIWQSTRTNQINIHILSNNCSWYLFHNSHHHQSHIQLEWHWCA